MPFTDSQLKANWGEQFVAAQLAGKGCFIRHVTQGHDCGIDLYCETTDDGLPIQHFWCQVKTSKKYSKEQDPILFTTDEKHKEYWLRQPVPVYIFLVPDLRNAPSVPFYICNAFDFWQNNSIGPFLKIISPKDLDSFFKTELPLQTFMWELKAGKVGYIKSKNEQYVKKFPAGFTIGFETEILQTVRWALSRFSADAIVGFGDILSFVKNFKHDDNLIPLVEHIEPYIQALELIITAKHDRHYEDYLILAICYELKMNKKKASYCYSQVIESVHSDSKLPKEDPFWQEVVAVAQNRINNLAEG